MFGYKTKKLLINLFVFLLPTQLTYYFWPNYAFIFGIRVDYFAPVIYLTDLIALILILQNYKKIFKYKNIYLIVGAFAIANILFSELLFVSLFKWLKVFEYISIAIVLAKKDISKALYPSLVIISVIGIAQFFISQTTGLLYILGERSFDIQTPGIALVEIFGKDYLRAYSLFPHPNALAGYLLLGFMYLRHKKYNFDWKLMLISICFILTFSLAGYIGLIFYLQFRNIPVKPFLIATIFLSFLMPFVIFFKTIDIERYNLATESVKVISTHFWFGSGLGTFPMFSSIRQPVHNIFLLLFSETGIFGTMAILIILSKYISKLKFFYTVLVLGLFDHYFLTINQDLILLSILAGLW